MIVTEMSFPSAPPDSAPRRRAWPMVLVMVFLMVLGVGAGLYGVVRLTVGYRPYLAAGGSMSPTLPPDSRIVVRDRGGDEVHRGDVVLFDQAAFATSDAAGPTVFRVVGVAGDTVACCDGGKLTVNGKPVAESYLSTGEYAQDPVATTAFSVQVPPETVFVAGDNRGNADDSRFRGVVRLAGISGFVVATGTVLTPAPLPAVTAFTDAGLPGAPFADSTLTGLRWWIVAGVVVFFAGLIGLVVTLVRHAGRRRRAAAGPPGR